MARQSAIAWPPWRGWLVETVDGNQKSGYHQLRLVVFFPLFARFSHHPNGGWEWNL